jgi:hypothetical protein
VGGTFLLHAVQHDKALGDTDLRRGQADAGRVIHGLQHVVGQPAKFVAEVGDRFSDLLEPRIGVNEDRQFHARGFSDPAAVPQVVALERRH